MTKTQRESLYQYLHEWLSKTFDCEVQSKLNGKEARFDKIFDIVCYRTDTGKPKAWMADFWIKKHNIIVEVNGGTFVNGRHNRALGYSDDLRKANTATANGCMYVQFTYEQLKAKEYEYLAKIAIGRKMNENKTFCHDYRKLNLVFDSNKLCFNCGVPMIKTHEGYFCKICKDER